MIGFLREKHAQENEFRQLELDVKRHEMQSFRLWWQISKNKQTYYAAITTNECCFFEYFG